MVANGSDRHAAELEAVVRLTAVRDACDAFISGNWALDSGLLLIVAQLLDQAGAWAMVAEELARTERAA